MSKVCYEPVVSILIPVYNTEKYLYDCLYAIVNQTYKNLEIIIINDGSTDKSDEICKSFVNSDKRIVYEYKNNTGVGDTRNKLLSRFTGDYFIFVDSDDVMDLNYVQTFVDFINEFNDVDIAVCYFKTNNKVRYLKDSELKYGEFSNTAIIKEILVGGLVVGNCGKLFKRKVSKDMIYKTDKIVDDNYVIFNLLDKYNIGITNKTFYIYNIANSSSITRNRINYIKRNNDLYNSLYIIENLIHEKYNDLNPFLDVYIFYFIVWIVQSDIIINNYDKTYYDSLKKLKSIKFLNLFKNSLNRTYPVRFILIRYFEPFFRKLYRFYYFILKHNK